LARVKDYWYSEVPRKDADGNAVKGPDGRVVKEKRKTPKHPDNGGNRKAKRWLACWTGPDGKEASKAFAKKTDAEAHATAMEADALKGVRHADPKRGATTVREYGNDVFMPAMLHLRPNSADTYASHLKNHVYPSLGDQKMAEITRTAVQSFVAVVSGKLAASTTETVYAVLRAMMQHAVDADPQVIAANLNPKVIQARLGHATITETMDTCRYTCSPTPKTSGAARSTPFSRHPRNPRRTWDGPRRACSRSAPGQGRKGG
jgi:hypothetical protein